MSKRKTLILVTIVGAIMIQSKDDFRIIGIFCLGISFILAIIGILNSLITNYIFKELLRNMIVIKEIMENVLFNEAEELMTKICESHILMAKEDIKSLKKSKQYLSEEQFFIVLSIEKELEDIENQKTGRL